MVGIIKKKLILNNVQKDVVIQSCRSGKLDTTKLAEAFQGVQQVFMNTHHIETDKLNVCLLIDQSGSMSYDGRIEMAQSLAITLYEAVNGIDNLNLWIFGHTGDNKVYVDAEGNQDQECTTILEYVTPDKQTRFDKYVLGTIRALAENRDGDAIRYVVDRISRFSKERTLLIVLSDGSPAASGYGGSMGIKDVKEAVTEAEKKRCYVIQASCSPDLDSRTMSRMFSHYVEYNYRMDLNEFTKNLAIEIKRSIGFLTKTHY